MATIVELILFLFVSFPRRIDPYTRSMKVLGVLFAIGFVLIVIIVLSLIPLYISQNSTSASSNIQVPSK